MLHGRVILQHETHPIWGWSTHASLDPQALRFPPSCSALPKFGMCSKASSHTTILSGARPALPGTPQAWALIGSLEGLVTQGETSISPRRLEQLLAQATAGGTKNPLLQAQVGADLLAQDPAAVVEPVDHVIWWQLEATPLPSSYPWSEAEITYNTPATALCVYRKGRKVLVKITTLIGMTGNTYS